VDNAHVIGTSGSTDYLSDTTSGRRYWPVKVKLAPDDSLASRISARLRRDNLMEIYLGHCYGSPAPAIDNWFDAALNAYHARWLEART
jgi:hypothetical protein